MYYYEGNNRGSYDILKKESSGNIIFIGEIMNIDDVEAIVYLFNLPTED